MNATTRLALVLLLAPLLLAACGEEEDPATTAPPNAGWIHIEAHDLNSDGTLWVAGTAFFSPGYYACTCAGKACLECLGTCDPGVWVGVHNTTNGASGSVRQYADPCTHRWSADVAVVPGANTIVASASDPAGNSGRATLTVSVSGTAVVAERLPEPLLLRASPTACDARLLALRLAGEAVMLVHALLIGFVALGLGGVALGGPLRWRWVRHRGFRAAHLLAVTAIAAIALAGWVCPLTWLEGLIWQQAGPGSLVGRVLYDLLYLRVPPVLFTWPVDGAVLLATLALWRLVAPDDAGRGA